MSAANRRMPEITDEEEARIQAGIAQDPDNPELTDEELAAMRPAREVLPPDVMAALATLSPGQRRSRGRAGKAQVTLRLDADALAAWKASGPGWQTRMGEVVTREAPRAKRSG